MYILVVKGFEDDGAYSVIQENGTRVLYLFEDEDDALRYIGLLEADGYPDMDTIEVESDLATMACENFGYSYCVVTKNDFVVPPEMNKTEMI